MRCKVGDLAVIIYAVPEKSYFIGKIVTVLLWKGIHLGWAFDLNGETYFADDTSLRHIRDPGDDAIDEMILIAGKPKKEIA